VSLPGARGKKVRAHTRIFIGVSIAALWLSAFALNAQNKKTTPPPIFRVDVETVSVKVSVTDPLVRYVTGLEKEHFKVYEDNVEQAITHFSQEAAPISAGIIFDVSASMKDNNNIKKAKNAITRFLESGNPQDELFLITFNNKTNLALDFTDQSTALENEAALQKPGGTTALWDAVYMGLNKIKEGKREKKALIVITDGEDNSSRYSAGEISDFAKELDVQIYAIGQQGTLGDTGRYSIQSIVNLTGGRAFFPNSFSELDYYVDLIHAELRSQYVLWYHPTNKVHDGKWRRIKVKLDAPRGLPKLIVRAKEGYNAPKL
jgi:Ca-activated chloride channel family protein